MRRKTTEEIIERIKTQFNNTLDTSKVVYRGDKVNIILGCSKHGKFELTPNNLWKSPCGCPDCSRENREIKNKMTTERFIKESTEKHKGKYGYEKTEFIDDETRVIVTCPIHGDFPQLPYHHLNGHGCPKCAGKNKTTEEIVEEFKKIHGNKYDYSKVEYKGDKENVTIICSIHGEFPQTPRNHLKGHGCYECGRERIRSAVRKRILPYADFLKEAKEIHGDKYTYNETTYKSGGEPMEVKCNTCGYVFNIEPKRHIKGDKSGCEKCARKEVGLLQRKTNEQFIEDARRVHGNKYDYSKTEYSTSHDNVIIICPEHGEFKQPAYCHTTGKHGCPICNESLLEKEIRLFLQKHNITYKPQDNLNGVLGKQTVDFYLSDYNLVVECQGKQHFGLTDFFEESEIIYYRDLKKAKILKENNVKLIYYTNEDRETVLNHETGLYNENNTYFDLSFLNRLLDKKDVVREITEEIKKHFNEFDVEIEENKKIGTTTVNLYFPQFNTGVNITDVNVGTEWKYGFERHNRLDQTNECINNGISLIQLFSDEWFQNKELILKKLSHILGLNGNKPAIMGRKCKIREINKTMAFSFLEKNHIQGSVAATVYLGAFYNDQLVAVMSFRKEGKENDWDLNRFASDNNYRCIGLGGKLFKYFVKNYDPAEIKSFADKRWTIKYDDNLYTNLGFRLTEHTKPDYRYINEDKEPNIRHHKFGFRKERLNSKYNLPMTLTEVEMVKRIGYDRIWDCGLIKYVWKK